MIFNFKKNKDKSVEVSNIDEFTDLLAEKLNAKNDELMLLTQENDSLKQKLAASELTVSDYQKKIKKSDNQLKVYKDEWRNVEKEKERLESKYTEVKKRLKDLAEENENYNGLLNISAENEHILRDEIKQLKKTKVSERYTLLKKTCDEQLLRIDTYEFISDESNRQTVIDNFSHNLSKWISDKNLTDTEVAKKLDTSRNIVGNLRTGNRAVNVNTIQKFDIELCEYFECSVYELVTVKMEGKKNDRKRI